MKHLYEVVFEVLWTGKGRRPYWGGDDEVVSLVTNGDARVAIRKAERLVRRRTLYWRGYGAKWGVGNVKLVSAKRLQVIDQ